MRRYWSITWNWWKNTNLFKRKYWTFIIIFLFTLLPIMIFLFLETRNTNWLIFSIILSLFILLISWKWFIAALIFIPSLFFLQTSLNNININKIDGEYKIIQIISSGYIIQENHNKILLKSKQNFNLDDLITVYSDNIVNLKNKKEMYDYYLKSLNIKFIANKCKILKANNKISIRSSIANYLSTGPIFYVKYIALILTGKRNDKNKDLYEKVKVISILHLFVISGFHINLIFMSLIWIFRKIRIKDLCANIICFIVLLLYIYFINFSISSIRAFIFIALCFINKKFLHYKFNKIEILSILMLSFFIFNPFIIFSLSFILTFLITFTILFVSGKRNKGISIFLITIFSYLSSILILIYINKWLNIFGIINSIIFSPIIIINYFVSIILLPFKNILNIYFNIIDHIVNLFYNNAIVINLQISGDLLNWYYSILLLIISLIKQQNINQNQKINNIAFVR